MNRLSNIFIAVAWVVFSLLPVGVVLAQGTQPGPEDGSYGLNKAAQNADYSTSDNVYSIVNATVNGLLALTAFIFFGLMLYSGIRWMTARGNEEMVAKAKGTMESTLIGLIVVALAYALTNFIFSKLG